MRMPIIPLLALLLLSCGLEDFPLIYPVPQSDIQQVSNNRSVVRISSENAGTTLSHFAIFYRIYVSTTDHLATGFGNSVVYPVINPTLASDHTAVLPHIDSTTLLNQNMDRFFTDRGFEYLSLEAPHRIDSVLSSSILGSTLEFDFPSRRAPTMTIGSTVYTLWRSNGNGAFNPEPDRLFINDVDLWSSENLNEATNRDVVDMPGIGSGDRRYIYAAMYIVGVGINVATYSFIYSTPSLIHVFQLPDKW